MKFEFSREGGRFPSKTTLEAILFSHSISIFLLGQVVFATLDDAGSFALEEHIVQHLPPFSAFGRHVCRRRPDSQGPRGDHSNMTSALGIRGGSNIPQ